MSKASAKFYTFVRAHGEAYDENVDELLALTLDELQDLALEYVEKSAIPHLTRHQLIHEVADGQAMAATIGLLG